MAIQKRFTQLIIRTAAEFAATTGNIPGGLFCLTSDTGVLKVGNGSQKYSDLASFIPGAMTQADILALISSAVYTKTEVDGLLTTINTAVAALDTKFGDYSTTAQADAAYVDKTTYNTDKETSNTTISSQGTRLGILEESVTTLALANQDDISMEDALVAFYTKTQSDDNFAPKAITYTKTEVDTKVTALEAADTALDDRVTDLEDAQFEVVFGTLTVEEFDDLVS